jgi:transposase-like protein
LVCFVDLCRAPLVEENFESLVGKRPDLHIWTGASEKGRLRGRPGWPAPEGLSAKEIEGRKAADCRRIVAPGRTVAGVARAHGVWAGQFFEWRIAYRRRAGGRCADLVRAVARSPLRSLAALASLIHIHGRSRRHLHRVATRSRGNPWRR